jgi:branched-chain amino acid transport system substrate-binding protein
VDAVMVNTINAPFEALAQNTLRELLPRKQVFSTSLAFQTGTDKLADPGALKGVVAIANLDPTKPGAQMVADFIKSTKGPAYQFTLTDLVAWDAMFILKTVIEKAGADDSQKITGAFLTLSGYHPTWGQPNETLSYSNTKHDGADGLCGFVLLEWGADNKPSKPWPTFQPSC